MSNNLRRDVQHLTDSTPEYRLRIGEYRVLFEIEGSNVCSGNGITIVTDEKKAKSLTEVRLQSSSQS